MTVQYDKNATATLQFTVTEQDHARAIEGMVQHYQHTAKIKGFRPGKAPRELVLQQLHMEALRQEARGRAIEKAYTALAVAEDLQLLRILDMQGADGDFPLHITLRVEHAPQLTVEDIESLQLPPLDVTVTEEDLAQVRAEMMRDLGYGTVVERAAAAGDMVDAAFYATDEQEQVIPSTKSDRMTVVIGSGTLIPALEQAFIGMSAGDEKEAPVAFPADYPAPDFAGKTFPFHITLQSVKEVPQAFTEDFLTAYHQRHGGDALTLEEFSQRLEDHIRQQKTDTARKAQMAAFEQQLVAKTRGDLPESWIEESAAQRLQSVQRSWQYLQDPEQYWQQLGRTEAVFLQEARELARREYTVHLAYRYIIDALGVALTPDRAILAEELAKYELQRGKKRGSKRSYDDYLREATFRMQVEQWLESIQQQ